MSNEKIDVLAVMDSIERDYEVLLPDQAAQIRALKALRRKHRVIQCLSCQGKSLPRSSALPRRQDGVGDPAHAVQVASL